MFEGIGRFFNNGLSSMQGVQGPPTKDGMLPTVPIVGGASGGAGGMGDLMSLAGPVLEGLMGEGSKQETLPTPNVSAPPLGRGGQVNPITLPQFNPGSIAARLRGQM